MKKVLIGLAAFILLAVVLTAGCTSTSDTVTDPIVGTWQYDGLDYDFVYTFDADGTVTNLVYLAGTKDVDGKYVGKWNLKDGVYTATFDFAGELDYDTFTITSDGKKIIDQYDLDYHKV